MNSFPTHKVKTKRPLAWAPLKHQQPGLCFHTWDTHHTRYNAFSMMSTWRWDAVPLANLTQHSTLTKARKSPKRLSGSLYISESGGSLKIQTKEHQTSFTGNEWDKSAIVKYTHQLNHLIDWPNKLLAFINLWHTRRVREAIEIHQDNKLQQDSGLVIDDIRRPVHDRLTSQH